MGRNLPGTSLRCSGLTRRSAFPVVLALARRLDLLSLLSRGLARGLRSHPAGNAALPRFLGCLAGCLGMAQQEYALPVKVLNPGHH
jgi:hypothetical protein